LLAVKLLRNGVRMGQLSKSGLAGTGMCTARIAVACAALYGLGAANPLAHAEDRGSYAALLE
jgi:hypothetical protein